MAQLMTSFRSDKHAFFRSHSIAAAPDGHELTFGTDPSTDPPASYSSQWGPPDDRAFNHNDAEALPPVTPLIEFQGLGFVISADYPDSIQMLGEMETDLDKPSLKLIREILPQCDEMAWKYGDAWKARLAFLTGLLEVRKALKEADEGGAKAEYASCVGIKYWVYRCEICLRVRRILTKSTGGRRCVSCNQPKEERRKKKNSSTA